MSTIAEIQDAIEKLPPQEVEALSTWFSSREEMEMTADEEAALLAALEKAERQLASGKGVSLENARDRVRQWLQNNFLARIVGASWRNRPPHCSRQT